MLVRAGLTVQMQLDYYNYGKAPGLEPPLNSNPEKSGLGTVCVLTLRPYLLWTREESMSAINRHPFYAQVGRLGETWHSGDGTVLLTSMPKTILKADQE